MRELNSNQKNILEKNIKVGADEFKFKVNEEITVSRKITNNESYK